MILAIDPGLKAAPGGTGWCLWDESPHSWGIISVKPGTPWRKILSVTQQIRTLLKTVTVYSAIIEWADPQIGVYRERRERSAGGVGVRELMNLSALQGAICQTITEWGGIAVEVVTPQKWKGTLSEDDVRLSAATLVAMPHQGHGSLHSDAAHAILLARWAWKQQVLLNAIWRNK